jgi:uncharacterized repeat protein (TIGR01451 family)/fimbrial isopeptide formation D2 family protein
MKQPCRYPNQGDRWKGKFPYKALMSHGSTLGLSLLILFALLLGTASPALAVEKFCSDPPYFGVIDGNRHPDPVQITIDRDCTFQNFPQSNPLTSTINFQTNDPTIYLIIFNNVYYTGNMACANIDHRIWFSNSSYYGSNNACQDLFIPVETIDKKNPAGQTTAVVGVPFTYTLTLPTMNLGGGPSPNNLHSVAFWDDLAATGVDLTFLGINAYYKGSGVPVTLVPQNDPSAPGGAWTPKNLSYQIFPPRSQQFIPAGEQIVIEITVVLDDTQANEPGKTFVNTAKWQFGRLIDGVYYEPLPGEWGVTPPLTIVKPGLLVTKTGPTSVINLGQWANFTIDAWNSGPWSGNAWNVTLLDRLPSSSSTRLGGGMCDMTPEVTGVTLGTRSLTQGTDYLLSYAGCDLSFALLEAASPIGPDQHLTIAYRTKVDPDSQNGDVLTNVAAATRWSSAQDNTVGQTYTCPPPINGTEGIADCQDAHTLLVALSGYFFEKTVANPGTGQIVTTAMPGETLRYTLRLQSIDNTFTGVRFYDDLNTANAFVPGSLSLVSYPPGADVSQTGNGRLDIRNLNVAPLGVIEVKFDITLGSTLNEGFVVVNQSDLMQGAVKIADSDDPNINGQADPNVPGDEDPTRVVIAVPAAPPPTKALVTPTIPEATIGQEVAYEIRVPGTVSARPVYDVVVTDTLDGNLEYLGFTPTSGPAVTDNSVAPNLSFGVTQIPAGQQAVFRVRARVRNVLGAQQGIAINNTASYTYANTPGGTKQPALTSGTVTFYVVEPHITNITKSADPTTPAAGQTVRYSVTLTASGGTYSSDVFDVTITDTLGLGLVYAGNPTVTVGGGVSANNTIGAPVITGDGINQAQRLLWSLERGNADIDIAEGTSITISYDVRVRDGVIAQTLANSAVAQWTGTDGPNAFERNGTDGIGGLNDYVTAPATATIGNLPLLYAHKTARIYEDFSSPGIVDPGDVLRYTIVLSNSGAIPATGVVLRDAVPDNTTYVADSLRLNGAPVGPDGGVSPLIAGLSVQSSDNPGAGIVSPGQSAVVTFEARVNPGVLTGTLIINQGTVTSGELPPVRTDADGVPSNGNQPTIVVVGAVQLVSITKEVSVVGGGIAVAGGQLEYVIRVNNIGSLPATRVVVTDDLNPPLGDQVTYVDGSGTLNDSTDGVTYSGRVLTANYADRYSDLSPGAVAVVRFRVQINSTLAVGTTITNTGVVRWNDPVQTASASVSLDIGGTPGSASLNGYVWHDANLDKLWGSGTETMMEGWSVELFRNDQLVTTALTDANGFYRFSGLPPNAGTSDLYALRFRAPGAGPNTASLGQADSPFTNGPQRISGITVASGANLQNLDLPLWPNGTAYNSVARTPVAGARLTMLNAATGAALPSQCFDDPVQQNQVTAANGFYKFDLNFSDASCPAGGDYLIEVTPPATGYTSGPSRIIPPSSDAPFSVPDCPRNGADAVPATSYCEVVASASVPPPSVLPGAAGTVYHLLLLLSNGTVPAESQAFNNLIPLDPVLDGAVAISKSSSLTNVTKGTLVPYTITVTNVYGAPLSDIGIVDRFPAGFKYVAGSARLDGNPTEPLINGRELAWDNLVLQSNQRRTIRFLLVVGSGVSEGEYVNRASVRNTTTGASISGEATATVRVIPDPDFDCTDVIGKVFDDTNRNGDQDSGEKGLFGVRVVTARGLIASTDNNGRFHITCAAVPDEDRGSNFILKLDERSLPSGYRLTTENPRVQRATRGKMLRFNFGAAIHRVVRMDIADGAFEPGTTEIRMPWTPRIDQLLEELRKGPSVLRLSYLGDVEPKGLALERLEALKKEITARWKQSGAGYQLTIETEIFWRRGAPIAGHR